MSISIKSRQWVTEYKQIYQKCLIHKIILELKYPILQVFSWGMHKANLANKRIVLLSRNLKQGEFLQW